MPGPPPKRSAERRRRNSPAAERVRVQGAVEPPEVDGRLHHLAVEWYESLAESGQSQYFEPSDWVAAQIVAGRLSKVLSAKKFSSAAFEAVWGAMNDLLTTEAARRRLRVEIERVEPPEEEDGVTSIDDYREMVNS